MDPRRVAVRDGKAFRVSTLRVECEYIDSDYTFPGEEEAKEREMTTTGHLKVFELVPATPTLPRFTGRWDQGRDCCIDIDMDGTSGSAIRDFRQGRRGYRGHHPARQASGQFLVDLTLPGNRRVFKGVVSLGLGRDLELGGRGVPY